MQRGSRTGLDAPGRSVVDRLLQRMLRDERIRDEASADEMLLNDPLENGRVAPGVPRAFRVDDRDRSAFANAQAVGLGAQDAALLGQAELLQPPFEKVPRGEPAVFLAALRVGLVAAEEDVAARDGDA